MRIFCVFLVGIKQKFRDRLGLLLTVSTAPCFVFLYWIFFNDATAVYPVGVLTTSRDSAEIHETGVTQALAALSPNGTPFFEIIPVADEQTLLNMLIEGKAILGITLDDTFSSSLTLPGRVPQVTLTGSASSPGYRVSAAIATKVIEGYVSQIREIPPLVQVKEVSIGLSGARTPFEAYVPGLLVFAVIMLIFSSAMTVAKEVESGTLARIRLTPVHPVTLLLGLSAVQLLIGGASVLLTLIAAFALGFRSQGSILLAMGIASLASLATVGIGMVVASMAKSQTRAFLFGAIAMFLLILFSGIVFPRPEVTVLTIGEHKIDFFDVLPTTHMGSALEKVMTLGADSADVSYEIISLLVIGLLSFLLGGLLFARSGRPSAQGWDGMP
jgi:ABC-type multidrug transport system permease subunit